MLERIDVKDRVFMRDGQNVGTSIKIHKWDLSIINDSIVAVPSSKVATESLYVFKLVNGSLFMVNTTLESYAYFHNEDYQKVLDLFSNCKLINCHNKTEIDIANIAYKIISEDDTDITLSYKVDLEDEECTIEKIVNTSIFDKKNFIIESFDLNYNVTRTYIVNIENLPNDILYQDIVDNFDVSEFSIKEGVSNE